MTPLAILSGWKTYIAAFGLVALAAYQLTQGDVMGSIQSFLAALAAAGLRNAIAAAPTVAAVPPTAAVQPPVVKYR